MAPAGNFPTALPPCCLQSRAAPRPPSDLHRGSLRTLPRGHPAEGLCRVDIRPPLGLNTDKILQMIVKPCTLSSPRCPWATTCEPANATARRNVTIAPPLPPRPSRPLQGAQLARGLGPRPPSSRRQPHRPVVGGLSSSAVPQATRHRVEPPNAGNGPRKSISHIGSAPAEGHSWPRFLPRSGKTSS